MRRQVGQHRRGRGPVDRQQLCHIAEMNGDAITLARTGCEGVSLSEVNPDLRSLGLPGFPAVGSPLCHAWPATLMQ
jgi:hypothetical protein